MDTAPKIPPGIFGAVSAMDQETGIRMSGNFGRGRPMAILKRPSGARLLDDRYAALQAVQTDRCHDPDCRRSGLDGLDAFRLEPISDVLGWRRDGPYPASLSRDGQYRLGYRPLNARRGLPR